MFTKSIKRGIQRMSPDQLSEDEDQSTGHIRVPPPYHNYEVS